MQLSLYIPLFIILPKYINSFNPLFLSTLQSEIDPNRLEKLDQFYRLDRLYSVLKWSLILPN